MPSWRRSSPAPAATCSSRFGRATSSPASRRVGRGESLLDPAVTGRVLERVRRIATADQPDELAQLTTQERKILLLVAEGKTNKEIAAEVFLSDKTVKN